MVFSQRHPVFMFFFLLVFLDKSKYIMADIICRIPIVGSICRDRTPQPPPLPTPTTIRQLTTHPPPSQPLTTQENKDISSDESTNGTGIIITGVLIGLAFCGLMIFLVLLLRKRSNASKKALIERINYDVSMATEHSADRYARLNPDKDSEPVDPDYDNVEDLSDGHS